MKKTYLYILLTLLALPAEAQRRWRNVVTPPAPETSGLNDSIAEVGARYAARIDSLAAASRRIRPHEVKALDNPYYYPLFVGNTVMQMPLHETIGSLPTAAATTRGLSIMPTSLPQMSWTLIEAYATHPELVRLNLAAPTIESITAAVETSTALPADEKPAAQTREEAKMTAAAPIEISKETHTDLDEELDLSDFHIHIRRPNFWVFKGQFSAQFMQYYVTDNWYKGGDNHVSMLGNFNIEANYDNKRKLTFSNRLETKLGFQSAPNDTHHKFRTNADLIRLTDKLGIKAWHHWDYTFMLQSWTQFYKNYQSNSDNVASDFMSPFEAVLSAGMDYKLQKKRVNFTATLSPVAANMKYCDREGLIGKHGIEAGKHSKIDLGSTVTVNMTLKFCEQVNWATRLYAFYDYKGHIKTEWENTVNLKVNKYLSTKLFLYPRFDNNVKRDDEKYLQFNEYLSVGLDLNF